MTAPALLDSDVEWACAACTAINPPHTDFCWNCHGRRSDPAPPAIAAAREAARVARERQAEKDRRPLPSGFTATVLLTLLVIALAFVWLVLAVLKAAASGGRS